MKLGTPLFVQIEITAECPYDCRFCYNVWKGGVSRINRLTKEQAMYVVDQLIRCRVFSVIISGGEPTLVPFLPELIAKFVDNNIEVTLITNGSRLGKPYLQRLQAVGLEGLQISMHHFRQDRMNEITGRPGSYDQTLRGVRETMQVFGPNRFSVNMVVTKDTVADVTAMGEFLHGLGVVQFSVGLVSYCGLAAVHHLAVDKVDLEVTYRQLESLHYQLGLDVSLTGGMPLCLVPGNGQDGVVAISNLCDAGINQIVIGPDGGMRPCVEMPIVVGNIFADNVIDVWRSSPELISIRRFENVPPSCYDCTLVGDCHGGCRASALLYTGDSRGLDPLMRVSR